MIHLELLAPARDINIGIAAIDCGADAVYMAGPAFGARLAAGNSIEDIRTLCNYAHRFGARIFVTLNTILYDGEIDRAFQMALDCEEAGADALIVQDFALLTLLGGSPRLHIPLHASTQCSIRSVGKARLLESLGFSRIVLERQLSLGETEKICSAVKCEVESFVHGALCVCYSGQCYLSEMLSGRSANRGCCVQACRSRYDLVDVDGAPVRDGCGRALASGRTLLSLRDLNLLEHLEQLAGAGVSSFKIEGRLKNISYVRNVVSAYSQALDALTAKYPERYGRASFGHCRYGFTPDLGKTFNRSYTELLLNGERGHWACLNAGKSLGEPVGTVEAVSHIATGAKIRLAPAPGGREVPALNNGDGFSYIGAAGGDCGFRGDVCRGNEIFIGRAGQDAACTDALKGLKAGTLLYRNLDTAFEKELARSADRSLEVSVSLLFENMPPSAGARPEDAWAQPTETGARSENAEMRPTDGDDRHADLRGRRLTVRAVSEDGREITLTRDVSSLSTAENRARMEEVFKTQIGKKTGHLSFRLEDIRSDGALPLMRAAEINELRRAVAADLDKLPVKARELYKGAASAASASECAEKLFCIREGRKVIDYRFDVANKIAAGIWHSLGADVVEPAYEIAHGSGEDIELMKTRYCIRYELGLCPKHGRGTDCGHSSGRGRIPDRLFLRNNGRMLELRFDCTKCEMSIVACSQKPTDPPPRTPDPHPRNGR